MLALICATFAPVGGVACRRPCEGPGCEERYSGALVGVHRGADLLTGTLDPLEATGTLEGSAVQGPDWSVALLPQALAVGIPDLAQVLAVPLSPLQGQEGVALDLASETGSVLGLDPQERLGAALARSRDHDGDGVADLLVGAPGTRRTATSVDDGAVRLFSGLGEGLDRAWVPEDATLTVLGEDPGGMLGEVLTACGDLDGDGLDDWAAAAPRANGRQDLAGRVVLGLSTDTRTADAVIEADALPTSWYGSSLGARAGSGLSCLHDLTADGTPDLVVGAPFADGDDAGEARGAIHVLAGGARMEGGGTNRLLAEAAAYTLEGGVDQEWLGWSVTTGDLDGDGTVELVGGAPGWSEQQGRVLAWTDPARLGAAATQVLSVLGEASPDALGRTALAADLDGDGVSDLLLGAPRHDPAQTADDAGYDAGKLYLLPGDPARSWWGLGRPVADVATTTWVRTQAYLRTGAGVAVGDYDEDGAIDLVLVHRTDPG